MKNNKKIDLHIVSESVELKKLIEDFNNYYKAGNKKEILNTMLEIINLCDNVSIDNNLINDLLDCLNKSIEIYTNDCKLYYKRAYYYDLIGCYEVALKDIDKAIELDKNNNFYFIFKSFCLYNLAKYEEALNILEPIAITENNFHLYIKVALCKYNIGKYESALNSFYKAMEIEPNNMQIYRFIECHYIYNNELKNLFGNKIIDMLNKNIELHPDNENIIFYKGIFLLNLSKYDDAFKCFNDIKKLNLENITYDEEYLEYISTAYEYNINYFNYGIVDSNGYVINKSFSENAFEYYKALKCLNKLIELDNTNIIAYLKKSFMLFYLEEYDEVLCCFDRIIDLNSNLPNIKWDNFMLEGFKKSLLENKHIKDILNNMIIFLMHNQKHAEAIKYCNKYLLLDEFDEGSYNSKGISLSDLGKEKEALECYNKAIEILDSKFRNKACRNTFLLNKISMDYLFSIFYNNKGLTLQRLNDNTGALKIYEESIAYNKYEVKNYYNKACLLEKCEKIEEAKEYYTKCKENINYTLDNNLNSPNTYKLFCYIYYLKSKINMDDYDDIVDKIITKDLSEKRNYFIKNNSLYNYTKINERTIYNIFNEKLWLSHSNAFNDPVDPVIKNFKDKKRYDYLLNTIKIGCLTTNNENTLMWSHYGDEHRGVCIEYDISNVVNDDTIILKVDYNKNIINYAPINCEEEIYNTEYLLNLFSMKSKEWKYEDEYRILHYSKNQNEHGVLISLPIKSICFGVKTSEDDKKLIYEIIKNKKGNQIKFQQAKFNDKKLFEIKADDLYSNNLEFII